MLHMYGNNTSQSFKGLDSLASQIPNGNVPFDLIITSKFLTG